MQYLHFNEDKQRGTYDFPFEFYHVDDTHPQYVMSYNWHVEYEIIRILKGTFHITLDEKDFTARAGEVIFINSGILHSGVPDACVYECIVFDMNCFLKQNGACQPYIPKIIDHSAQIYHRLGQEHHAALTVIDSVFDAFAGHPRGYELQVFGGFYQFFGAVFAGHFYFEEPPQSLRDYRKIMQLKQGLGYIEANYQNPISLDQMSRDVNMEPK